LSGSPSGGNPFHISASEKSGAGAISTRPAIVARLAARFVISRAKSNAIQPPIDEPITTCGPAQNCSNTAILSSSHRPMVPSMKAPPDSPWPE
jgi:hypothetical protein